MQYMLNFGLVAAKQLGSCKQGGSDGAKKCDIQNLKWGGILFDQN